MAVVLPASVQHVPDPAPPTGPVYGIPTGHARCLRCAHTWPAGAGPTALTCRVPSAVFAEWDARTDREPTR